MRNAKRLAELEKAVKPRAAAVNKWQSPAFLDSLDRIYGVGGEKSQPMTWAEIEACIDRVYESDDDEAFTTIESN